jgi:hypothetical protein
MYRRKTPQHNAAQPGQRMRCRMMTFSRCRQSYRSFPFSGMNPVIHLLKSIVNTKGEKIGYFILESKKADHSA